MGLLLAGGAACGPADAPENPAWADVEPILRAECSGCHGASAGATGSGFRFDFYDMADSPAMPNPCGEAAAVLADTSLARAQADKIAKAITTTDPDVRPSMPPLPAPYLTDNQWLTILRWTANPVKGDKPPNNRPPQISVDGTSVPDASSLDVNVVVSDPDGDPVIGLLKIGDHVSQMDRSGAFAAHFDTTAWPAGSIEMSAVLCDGWSLISADLREIVIQR